MLDLDQNTDNLLKEFSASGIGISVEGNNLKIESVRPLTNNQRNLILKLKSDLLNYLHDKTKIEEHSSRVEVVAEKETFKNARHYLYIEPRVSDLERETLKKIFRQTTSTGSHLHRCTDAEQAERFNNFLMRNLPENFASGVIRDCEINTFNCKDDGRY